MTKSALCGVMANSGRARQREDFGENTGSTYAAEGSDPLDRAAPAQQNTNQRSSVCRTRFIQLSLLFGLHPFRLDLAERDLQLLLSHRGDDVVFAFHQGRKSSARDVGWIAL